jgi:predicted acetyltransferase
MRLYDFTMKLLSTRTLVGGLGSVAVDLLHKKEKVARDMILRFMDKTNGLMELSDSALEALFSDPALQIKNGRAHFPNNGNSDVEIRLDIAEFSSMVLGVINFSQLHCYGLAQISDERYLDMVNQLFSVAQRPICLTMF